MKNVRAAIIVFGIAMALSLCGCERVSDLIGDKGADKEVEEDVSLESDTSDEEESIAESEAVTEDEESTSSDSENRDEIAEKFKNMISGESGRSQEDIRFFDMDDFDNNGEYEAFALVGDETDYEYSEAGLINGNVWFVNKSEAQMLTDSVGMGYDCEDSMLDFDSKNYIVFQDVYATGELSRVFEVDGDNVSEVIFSGLGTVKGLDEDSFVIIDSSYDSEFDPDIVGLLGHTWKSYYFYYDKDSESVKEYGSSEITSEEVKKITGYDLVNDCLDDGDWLENILYRRNGLIHINYSRPGDRGCISYYHRTWDTEKECFIDDYAEESDEEQLGTYRTELCPEIAVYPAD